ncbi:MAG: 23S rRNA (uracil-5-)-methyltransferase RumA, partial [Bacteroidales bacterium]|nr:23S rRNA (uracil-5-)-methyltransferase RumA [Bacteroidales bacterium]
GDMKDVLGSSLFEQYGQPDLIVLDPPRAGVHPDVITAIRDTDAPRIVYVSCNPATQARDLALLSDRYAIQAVQPVDMFPHTHHVENVVLLKKY